MMYMASPISSFAILSEVLSLVISIHSENVACNIAHCYFVAASHLH